MSLIRLYIAILDRISALCVLKIRLFTFEPNRLFRLEKTDSMLLRGLYTFLLYFFAAFFL